ncbi:MAG: lipopolysaccharide biosynthesis protein [Hymenobacteraceae bacterium]|nr:lipopolysaccharide biosynthesis protein [Hymenobacteraceae bacterium]
MLRKLLSHAAIYGLAAQVPRLAGVLTLPIITQYLTTTDYGVAGVVTAYVTALNMVHSLGLSVVMVNSFARYPTRYKWVWRQLQGFLSVWSVVYSLLLGLVLWWGIPAEAAENKWELVLLNVLPVALFSGTELQAGLFFQMSQRPLPVALKSFVVGVLVVLLNIYTIAVLRMGYMGWFYSNFAGVTVGSLLYGYLLYSREKLWPIFNFKWHRIKASLRTSLPMVPHNFSFFLLDTSDKLVMDLLRVPVPRIGFYNLASSFGIYFMAASSAIVQASAPFYMRYYAQAKDKGSALKARSMTFMLQALFLTVTFLLGLWMKELFIMLIRNEALQAAYPLAIIILMGYNFRPMYLGAANQLVYREHTRVMWKVSAVAGVGNLVLNIILIPIYGIEAAAFTTFAALMYMGYSGYQLKEYKQVTQVNYYPWLWLTLTVLALLVVYLLAEVSLEVKVVATAFVSMLGAAAIYVINENTTKVAGT